MSWKYKEVNEETLTALDASKGCKEWFLRNIGTLPAENINKIEGDFNGYVSWLKKKYKKGKTNIIKDGSGNVISYTIDGVGITATYDSKGNQLTYKDSDGYSWERTYDKQGNMLTYKDSDGNSWERTYDSKGNELTYKNSYGELVKYTYKNDGEFFVVISNEVEILKMPLSR